MKKEMIFFLVLAMGVVGGVIGIADQSLTTKVRTADGGMPQKVNANTPTVAASPALARPLNSFPGISKCLQNGQTSYSNDGCPVGAKHQQVVLYDTAGIEDKSKEQLAAIRATNRPAMRAEGLVIQQVANQNTTSAVEKKRECELLKKQIESVDARARQPQSASSQDRLRAEKKRLRDRYFALRC